MIRINKCTKIVYLLWILAHFKRTTLMGNTWSRQDRGTKQFFNSWCTAWAPCSTNIKINEIYVWCGWPSIPSLLCSFPSRVAGWRSATSPLGRSPHCPPAQWTIKYLPASLLHPPISSSQTMLKTSKHTKCSKKQQNEKGHQVVPNETNKQKLYCALTQSGKFPSRFSVHGLYALQWLWVNPSVGSLSRSCIAQV